MAKWQKTGKLRCIIEQCDTDSRGNPLYQIWIQGPEGTVTARDLWWVTDRSDFVAWLYNEILLCLDGNYHCCLSDISTWA
jgi:hypothetical protein